MLLWKGRLKGGNIVAKRLLYFHMVYLHFIYRIIWSIVYYAAIENTFVTASDPISFRLIGISKPTSFAWRTFLSAIYVSLIVHGTNIVESLSEYGLFFWPEYLLAIFFVYGL